MCEPRRILGHALCLLLVACGNRAAEGTHSLSSANSSLNAKPVQAAPPKAVTTPAAPVQVPEGPPAPPPDPTFEAFMARIRKESKADPEPNTTADISGAIATEHEYAVRQTKLIVARLDPERRRYLLSPEEPRRKHPDDWHPAWNRFVDGKVLVEDYADYPGSFRPSGYIRRHTRGMNFVSGALQGLYWVESFSQNRAKEFAEHVRLVGRKAAEARKNQGTLLGITRKMRPLVPEVAEYDADCDMCEYGDQDIAKVERTLRGIPDAARALAQSMCLSWPELAHELGGSLACVERAGDFFVALVLPYNSVEEYDAQAPYAERPPPRDPAYASYADPVFDHCFLDPRSDERAPSTVYPCLRAELTQRFDALNGSHPSLSRPLRAAWRAFQDHLCALDDLALSVGQGMRRYPHCDWLTTLRFSFVLVQWTQNDTGTLLGHVRARNAWSINQVEPSFVQLEKYAALPACTAEYPTIFDCPQAMLTRSQWQTVVRLLPRIREDAALLAKLTCEGWPELASSVGGGCQKDFTAYYLSYAQASGVVAPDVQH